MADICCNCRFVLAASSSEPFYVRTCITDGYEAQSQIREDIRNGDLLKSLETFWKKVTRGEWDWLPVDIIRSSGVHGGKLSNVKEVRDYNETHLYLDISSDLKELYGQRLA